jgi:hypothetical protein
MEPEAKPTPPEALVGKDELDEDDEMELSTDELVETPDVESKSAREV